MGKGYKVLEPLSAPPDFYACPPPLNPDVQFSSISTEPLKPNEAPFSLWGPAHLGQQHREVRDDDV